MISIPLYFIFFVSLSLYAVQAQNDVSRPPGLGNDILESNTNSHFLNKKATSPKSTAPSPVTSPVISFATSTSSNATTSTSSDSTIQRKVAQIISATDFCMFLPPQPGLIVAPAEPNSTVFCSTPNNKLGPQFPTGLVTSQHFLHNVTFDYIQVTGCIDITKYNLQSTDEGGQFDSHGSPPGAICQGYPYFVNLLEPASGDYCIRCCKNSANCNTGRSQAGCWNLVQPGDYTQSDDITVCTHTASQLNTTGLNSTSMTNDTSSSNGTSSDGSQNNSSTSSTSTSSATKNYNILIFMGILSGFSALVVLF